jgi:TonB family protein
MFQHGVQGYFVERAKSTRRIAVVAFGLATLVSTPLIALTFPPFQHPLRNLLRRTTRFGYEGPDQFVRRITLQQRSGAHPVMREVGAVDMRHERSGGAVRARRSEDRHAAPETPTNILGPGLTDDDMTARSVSRLANVPVVQSEELIIVYASKPIYPPGESEQGVEGRVMVQALVDTTGHVVDVQLLASTGVPAFERSAADAVWQYRFRPYRMAGVPSEVYALFRFSFRIY